MISIPAQFVFLNPFHPCRPFARDLQEDINASRRQTDTFQSRALAARRRHDPERCYRALPVLVNARLPPWRLDDLIERSYGQW